MTVADMAMMARPSALLPEAGLRPSVDLDAAAPSELARRWSSGFAGAGRLNRESRVPASAAHRACGVPPVRGWIAPATCSERGGRGSATRHSLSAAREYSAAVDLAKCRLPETGQTGAAGVKYQARVSQHRGRGHLLEPSVARRWLKPEDRSHVHTCTPTTG
jgi:hypothetical protein